MIDSEQKMYTTAFNLKLKSDHVTRQNSELEDMIKGYNLNSQIFGKNHFCY